MKPYYGPMIAAALLVAAHPDPLDVLEDDRRYLVHEPGRRQGKTKGLAEDGVFPQTINTGSNARKRAEKLREKSWKGPAKTPRGLKGK